MDNIENMERIIADYNNQKANINELKTNLKEQENQKDQKGLESIQALETDITRLQAQKEGKLEYELNKIKKGEIRLNEDENVNEIIKEYEERISAKEKEINDKKKDVKLLKNIEEIKQQIKEKEAKIKEVASDENIIAINKGLADLDKQTTVNRIETNKRIIEIEEKISQNESKLKLARLKTQEHFANQEKEGVFELYNQETELENEGKRLAKEKEEMQLKLKKDDEIAKNKREKYVNILEELKKIRDEKIKQATYTGKATNENESKKTDEKHIENKVEPITENKIAEEEKQNVAENAEKTEKIEVEDKTIKLTPEQVAKIKEKAENKELTPEEVAEYSKKYNTFQENSEQEKEEKPQVENSAEKDQNINNYKPQMNYSKNVIERIQKENEAILHPDKESKPNLVAITCLTKLGIYLKTYDNGKVETFIPTNELSKANINSEVDLNITEMLSGNENIENLAAYKMDKNEFKIIYDNTINYKDYTNMLKETNDIDSLDSNTQLKKQTFKQKRLMKKMAKNQDKSRENVTTYTQAKKILNKIKSIKRLPKAIADRIPETKYDSSFEEVNTEMSKISKDRVNENNSMQKIENPLKSYRQKSQFLKELDARQYSNGLSPKDPQEIINSVEKDMGIDVSRTDNEEERED